MKKSILAIVAAGLAAAGSMRADIIPTLDTISATGAADFTWSYRATLTQDENAIATGSNGGDYFTIYDFGGFIPGTNAQPAGWTFSFSLLGTTPPKVTPADDPSIYNLTWHYVGGAGFPNEIVGPVNLGLFSAETTTDQLRLGEFAAEATKNTGPFSGTPVDNIGSVAIPIPEMSALLPMIGVCGLGAIGLASSWWRRRAPR
ncbi:MAG: hypothetical protein DLM52_03835 [Chthoniobacterales bacterium]|nr:MAG: hypothetical protein DLM52_03835 [Chthoniobacterales bacterium]